MGQVVEMYKEGYDLIMRTIREIDVHTTYTELIKAIGEIKAIAVENRYEDILLKCGEIDVSTSEHDIRETLQIVYMKAYKIKESVQPGKLKN